MEKGKAIGDVWNDIMSFQQIPTAKERLPYPTQKPEALLKRIIKASSNEGDIVLDCFAGTGICPRSCRKVGQTLVIGVDCGKLAIYTDQKRLLNIRDSPDLENPDVNYGKECRPFSLFNAGLYDYKMIKDLLGRIIVILPSNCSSVGTSRIPSQRFNWTDIWALNMLLSLIIRNTKMP